jgi:hypothetical protein
MTKEQFFMLYSDKAIAHATKNFDKLNNFCADSHRVKDLNDEAKLQEFAQICLESWFDDSQF